MSLLFELANPLVFPSRLDGQSFKGGVVVIFVRLFDAVVRTMRGEPSSQLFVAKKKGVAFTRLFPVSLGKIAGLLFLHGELCSQGVYFVT